MNQTTIRVLTHSDTDHADRIAANVYDAVMHALYGELNITSTDECHIANAAAHLVASELGKLWSCDMPDTGSGVDRCQYCGRIAYRDGSCPVDCKP